MRLKKCFLLYMSKKNKNIISSNLFMLCNLMFSFSNYFIFLFRFCQQGVFKNQLKRFFNIQFTLLDSYFCHDVLCLKQKINSKSKFNNYYKTGVQLYMKKIQRYMLNLFQVLSLRKQQNTCVYLKKYYPFSKINVNNKLNRTTNKSI